MRCGADLSAFICFLHTEYVANRVTRRIPNDDHPPCEQAIADDSCFTVLFLDVFDLKGHTLEDCLGICEVQPPVPLALSRA